MSENNDKIRLVKFIAASGAASRRKAGDLVKEGRISINGQICLDPSFGVQQNDTVALDGKVLVPEEVKYYVALNKPRGYTCSNSDKHAEKLAVELITTPTPARLFSAGRLDCDSEGLIIFSNDGDFVAKLSHPSFKIIKRYIVETDTELNDNIIQRLKNGICDDNEILKAMNIERLSPRKYRFTLAEGKKREIRRMVRNSNANVLRLKRISIGKYTLPPDLTTGSFRFLTQDDIRSLICEDK